MTGTNGYGGVIDVCPVCDWGWRRELHESPPDSPVEGERSRRPLPYNVGSARCLGCEQWFTRHGGKHVRCKACARLHRMERDRERSRERVAARRAERERQAEKRRWIPSRLDLACA